MGNLKFYLIMLENLGTFLPTVCCFATSVHVNQKIPMALYLILCPQLFPFIYLDFPVTSLHLFGNMPSAYNSHLSSRYLNSLSINGNKCTSLPQRDGVKGWNAVMSRRWEDTVMMDAIFPMTFFFFTKAKQPFPIEVDGKAPESHGWEPWQSL